MKTLAVLLPIAAAAAAAVDGLTGNVDLLTRVGAAGALVIVLVWLGKLLKRFFEEHLRFVRAMAKATAIQARNMTLMVQELRNRPCIADDALPEVDRDPGDPDVEADDDNRDVPF